MEPEAINSYIFPDSSQFPPTSVYQIHSALMNYRLTWQDVDPLPLKTVVWHKADSF